MKRLMQGHFEFEPACAAKSEIESVLLQHVHKSPFLVIILCALETNLLHSGKQPLNELTKIKLFWLYSGRPILLPCLLWTSLWLTGSASRAHEHSRKPRRSVDVDDVLLTKKETKSSSSFIIYCLPRNAPIIPLLISREKLSFNTANALILQIMLEKINFCRQEAL
ncbi:hypothetical protein ABFX02_11G073400 [Erythranthe guttata]